MGDSSFPETAAERLRTLDDWSFLRPVREETVEIAKTGRYGEGAIKIRRWLETHPGWQDPRDLIRETGQLNFTARISEYNRFREPGEPPIRWNGQPRFTRYRLGDG